MQHINEEKGWVSKATEAQVNELLANPRRRFAKGFVKAYSVDEALYHLPQSPIPRVRYIDAESNSNHKPIRSLLFSVGHLFRDGGIVPYDTQFRQKIGEIQFEILEHLHSLGCPVTHTQINYADDFGHEYQMFVAVPEMRLVGEKESPTLEKDVEGMKLFVGYLLYRGFVSKREVIEVLPGYAGVLDEPEIAEKIESLKIERVIRPDAVIDHVAIARGSAVNRSSDLHDGLF